jgi:hypothetical protein
MRAHRYTDVRLLKRRRVVYAITGHRHDVASRLQRSNDGDFVLGRNAGEDRGVSHPFSNLVRREAIQVGNREHVFYWQREQAP